MTAAAAPTYAAVMEQRKEETISPSAGTVRVLGRIATTSHPTGRPGSSPHGQGAPHASTSSRAHSAHSARHGRQEHARPPVPLLVMSDSLPGPLGLHRLARHGIIRTLDHRTGGYTCVRARTLSGRGAIAGTMLPPGTAACMGLAAWVWLGGLFPDTIDIVSDSHFRSLVHGRRIRVFNRKTSDGDVMVISGSRVTAPARTACDLSLLPDAEFEALGGLGRVRELLDDYDVHPDECVQVLDRNRFWPNIRTARRRLAEIGATA